MCSPARIDRDKLAIEDRCLCRKLLKGVDHARQAVIMPVHGKGVRRRAITPPTAVARLHRNESRQP